MRGQAETGERDLGSSEPRRVLERANSFPGPGKGFSSGREGEGSSEWLSPLVLPIVEERREDFQVQNISKP